MAAHRDTSEDALGDSAVPARVDLAVRGGTLVTASGRRTADLGIVDGRIACIVPPGAPMPADRDIDASGAFVLPGAVDLHVHLDAERGEPADPTEPGFVDDLYTGSRAAIHGGVTTIGQMSFNDCDSLWPAVRHDLQRGEQQAAIDYLLHPGIYTVTDTAVGELTGLAAAGFGTLKLVTLALDDGPSPFIDAIAEAGRNGILTLIHCEDGAIIDAATRSLIDSGDGALENYPRSRPVPSETAAVERAIAIAETTGAPVYIVHLSSGAALDAVRRAKARGVAVFAETRPIYLYLTDAVHGEADGGRYIGMPPLRTPADIEALWRGLADGTIDTVATDHAPWMLADKVDATLDVATSRKGMAELDTFLPLLYSEGVRTGRLSLERLVAVTAANPAHIMGLTQKGDIRVGADADLVVLDPDAVRTVRSAELESAADYSVYEGRSVTGWPRYVLSRGDVVLEDGVVTAEPGRGRLLRTSPPRHPR